MNALDIILLSFGSLIFIALVSFFITSIAEKEKKAAGRSILLALTLPLPYILAAVLQFPGDRLTGWVLTGIFIVPIILFLIPTGRGKKIVQGFPQNRFDERHVMFSRYFMDPESWQFRQYYADNPDKIEIDRKIREAPGLLSLNAKYAHPLFFASADVGFDMCDYLSKIPNEGPAPRDALPDPSIVKPYLKNWLLHMGALSVGFTRLQDYHWYSHRGRGGEYGKKIVPSHEYALACTVEMDYHLIRSGPQASEVMEVAWKYLEVATLAVQAAAFIRSLGYSAQAHIDGNYQVLCPLVARDAGLGEIGRLGLIMTPECGPRVRIAVVTTDLPFITSKASFQSDIVDFCRKCTKCARCCPSQAIPHGDREEHDGVLRWRINHEKCFTFWCKTGSDCGQCLSACPYSHPNRPIHRSVRALSKNSSLFRSVAPGLDDLFYGKKPKPFPIPGWSGTMHPYK